MISWTIEPVQFIYKDVYNDGYRNAPITDLNRVANCMLKFVWSPNVWRGGQRLGVNFLKVDLLVLDFDDGKMRIEHADSEFSDYARIIAPTKSHHYDCHAFRVVIPFEREITLVHEYLGNLKLIAENYPIDTKCIEAARFYFPSKEIYCLHPEGKSWPIEYIKPEEVEPWKKFNTGFYQNKKTIPNWVDGLLTYGVPDGVRNTTCFKIAATLARYGHSPEHVYQMLINSPIPKKSSEREVYSAVKSGFKSCGGARR